MPYSKPSRRKRRRNANQADLLNQPDHQKNIMSETQKEVQGAIALHLNL